MAHLQANGIQLGYDSFGEGKAGTLVLIAGLGTQRIRWTDPFCDLLAGHGYRVIRFDNRDAGESTHFAQQPVPDIGSILQALAVGQTPPVPYTLHDMAADTIGLLDTLGIERAHLVGRSMGGMIAQIAASRYPERVASLTSIMSSTGNPALPQADPDVMQMLARPGPLPDADPAGFVGHGLAFARRIGSSGFPFDEAAHRALVLEEARRSHDSAGVGRQFGAIVATGDIRPLLARVTAPTLVVHGADDPLVLPACGRDTADSIRGAEFMLVAGMGHDLPPTLFASVAGRIHDVARRAGATADACS